MAKKPVEANVPKNDNNAELENLKRENAGLRAQLDGVMTELEAAKAMYNDALNNTYQLKTHNIMFTKRLQILSNELQELKKPKE